MESGLNIIEHHPTSGLLLKGLKAPFFKEVCELAVQLSRTFYLIRCVAWDIIVAKQGVYVIEGNNPWNVDVQEVYDKDYGLIFLLKRQVMLYRMGQQNHHGGKAEQM